LRCLAHRPTFRHTARSYHAVEVRSGKRINLFPLGDILRYASPKGAGGGLLPSLFGFRRRQVPKPGMAGASKAPGARTKTVKQARMPSTEAVASSPFAATNERSQNFPLARAREKVHS